MSVARSVANPTSAAAPRRVPTQERSRRRVEGILDAAARIVVARGVEALTTREIAARPAYRRLALPVLRRQGGRPARAGPARHGRDGRPGARPRWPTSRAGPPHGRLGGARHHGGLRRASTTGAARSWRSTCAAAPTLAVHRFGREHNARVAETSLREFAVDAGLVGTELTPERARLAVEVGDRIFQLAFEHDDEGDPVLVEEGIVLVTGYLERYATPAGSGLMSHERLRDEVAAAARRLAHEGLLVGTAGNVSARDGRPRRRHRLRRGPRRLPPEDVTVVSPAGGWSRASCARPPSCPSTSACTPTPAPRPSCTRTRRTRPRRLRARRAAGLHYQQLLLGGAIRVAPYATFGTPELAAARPRRARGPAGGADGQPRLGRGRRLARRRRSRTRCCSSGWPRCTTGPARSAPLAS